MDRFCHFANSGLKSISINLPQITSFGKISASDFQKITSLVPIKSVKNFILVSLLVFEIKWIRGSNFTVETSVIEKNYEVP